MMGTRVRRGLVLVAAVTTILSACASAALTSAPKILVTSARAPLPASPQVGATYLTIKNESSQPDVLVSATSDAASQTMVHHDVVNGMTETMVPAGPLTIGPGKSLVLAPGGYHIMLMDLTRRLSVGEVIHITLDFRRAGEIEVTVPVVPLVAGSSVDATMPPGMHMP